MVIRRMLTGDPPGDLTKLAGQLDRFPHSASAMTASGSIDAGVPASFTCTILR